MCADAATARLDTRNAGVSTSRVESLTKEVHAVILVSREIAARLGPEFILGRTNELPVKGRSQPVEVVEVLAASQPPGD